MADTKAAEGATARRSASVLFWLAIVWLTVVVLSAVLAPWLPLPDPLRSDVPARLAPPLTPGHPLGTDGLGRDLLSRLVWGARVSLTISVTVVVIAIVVGGALGIFVGYTRGRIDGVTTGILDVLLSVPPLILVLGLVAFVGQSLVAVVAVLSILAIPGLARVARANTMAIADRDYVLAARALGATKGRILVREILPAVAPTLVVIGLLVAGIFILVEGALSFLGLSVQPPDASWGSLIGDGIRYMRQTLTVILVPIVTLFLTVVSLNYVGDRLRVRSEARESDL
ncbi:MAG: ABC transporter permease [Chloroflexota bacterium]